MGHNGDMILMKSLSAAPSIGQFLRYQQRITPVDADRTFASCRGGLSDVRRGFTDPLLGKNPQRFDTVAPRDFLALFAGPRRIADRHLERAHLAAQQLAG